MGPKIMVATRPIDFGRAMNGLVALVATALAADPDDRRKLRATTAQHTGPALPQLYAVT